MTQTDRTDSKQLFEQVQQLLTVGADASSLLSQFGAAYLAALAPVDAAQFSAAGLTAAICALWSLGNNAAQQPLIKSGATGLPEGESPASVLCIVQSDRPFLIDSIGALLQASGIELTSAVHPILSVVRASDGTVTGLGDTAGGKPESWSQFFFGPVATDAYANLEQDTAAVLADVAAAVDDWQPLRSRLQEAQTQIAQTGTDAEAAAFLLWLDDGHFTFLGCRDYTVSGTAGAYSLSLMPGSGLGIVRDDSRMLFDGLRTTALAPDIQTFLAESKPLLVSKTRANATVHRAVPMDAIFIKLFDDSGRLTGLRLMVGLLTSLAYSRNARDIPLLRQKTVAIAARAGYAPSSHNGKALRHVLDTYPRDELFQATEDELYEIAQGIVQLRDRRRVALFVRRDPFDRYMSCLVYVPREVYDTQIRLRLIAELEASFGGTLNRYDLALDENPLVRLHAIIDLPDLNAAQSPVDLTALEDRLAQLCRNWADRLRDAAIAAHGHTQGLALLHRFENSFDLLYRDSVAPESALADLAVLQHLPQGESAVRFVDNGTTASFKVYQPDQPLDLSQTLPTLDNLGLHVESEHGPFHVTFEGRSYWLHDYIAVKSGTYDISATAPLVEEAYTAIRNGHAEDDRFNRLTLTATLPWREVMLLRALAKYLRQTDVPFTFSSVASSLGNHPEAVRLLAGLFRVKFDPDLSGARDQQLADLRHQLTAYIKGVPSLDDDRILSAYAELLDAALRTNYFQQDANGQPKPYLSIKLDSRRLSMLPLPKPFVEVWVYSPTVEGVHLRGGKVARGGIRWSDRRDFRTEILGLMKAQVVKNTVIVPTGSKGGFRVKHPELYPDARSGGIACYRELMQGLLDITDNYQGTAVIAPPRVVRHDGDDPYLVVAADKGTATFSDIANGISESYGFWLGDAFASGGSAGYDHKQMGITARGAWESVKRHFRELSLDTQAQDFTVIGVGDMAGDVFGNGMLLSPHIKLIAAFNYAHIFFDPTPDTARSFAERKRLFDLGRGSWDLYDAALLSPGGGVFPRSQKAIPLSPQVQQLLGVSDSELSPDALIRAILSLQADLLYFGGIGTYIRASDETDAQVGDKANDALRVDANAIRARVIGEGANLGITQRGRIQLSTRGIRLNTDAIDNSAGVDTSDHEVNIKILTASLIAEDQLTTAARDELLRSMTDDVAALVLRDNYLQTQALTLAEARASELLPAQRAFMLKLEADGTLNRKVEFLPPEAELAQREAARQGLTRPELATLLAYAKIWLDRQLTGTPLLRDPALQPELVGYFPPRLQAERAVITGHRLAPEIVATVLTNELVNRLGPTGVAQLMQDTGSSADNIARAYLIVRDAFGFVDLWQAIDSLDNQLPAQSQTMMQLAALHALAQAITAVLSRRATAEQDAVLPDIVAERTLLSGALAELQQSLETLATTDGESDLLTASLPGSRLPEPLAAQLRLLNWLPLLPRLSYIARASGQTIGAVIPLFVAVDERLQLRRLLRQLAQAETVTPFEAEALRLLSDDMLRVEQTLTAALLTDGAALLTDGGESGQPKLEAWLARQGHDLSRYDALLASLRSQTAPDFALWSLLGRELLQLVTA